MEKEGILGPVCRTDKQAASACALRVHGGRGRDTWTRHVPTCTISCLGLRFATESQRQSRPRNRLGQAVPGEGPSCRQRKKKTLWIMCTCGGRTMAYYYLLGCLGGRTRGFVDSWSRGVVDSSRCRLSWISRLSCPVCRRLLASHALGRQLLPLGTCRLCETAEWPLHSRAACPLAARQPHFGLPRGPRIGRSDPLPQLPLTNNGSMDGMGTGTGS